MWTGVTVQWSHLEVPPRLHPRRGAQCGNLEGYFYVVNLAVFALAHSKINQIAQFFDEIVQEVSD